MDFSWGQADFVGVVIAADCDSCQHIAHFRFIVDQLQQWLSVSSLLADTENVFCRRIERDDQQVLIEQNDACAKRVENRCCVSLQRAVVTGTAEAGR